MREMTDDEHFGPETRDMTRLYVLLALTVAGIFVVNALPGNAPANAFLKIGEDMTAMFVGLGISVALAAVGRRQTSRIGSSIVFGLIVLTWVLVGWTKVNATTSLTPSGLVQGAPLPWQANGFTPWGPETTLMIGCGEFRARRTNIMKIVFEVRAGQQTHSFAPTAGNDTSWLQGALGAQRAAAAAGVKPKRHARGVTDACVAEQKLVLPANDYTAFEALMATVQAPD